jgi:hypothetical protein
MVQYSYWTCWPVNVVTMLKRSISAYTRDVGSFKIGLTNNPERRFRQAYANRYRKMIVVYKTDSIHHVRKLENVLVDYYWEYNDNETGGGGGNYGPPPHYLYLVLGNELWTQL